MRRFVLRIGFMVVLLGIAVSTYADDNYGVHVYTKDEYRALADFPQLMVTLGVVSDFGTLPFASESSVGKDLQKKASKLGATGIHVFARAEKKGDNGWGIRGFQLHLTAEAFKFVEPTVENIRAAIHNPRTNSMAAIRNAMNVAQKGGHEELAEDILNEVLYGKMDNACKKILIDGFVALKGSDAAISGMKRVIAAKVDQSVKAHAGHYLPPPTDTKGMYREIVDASDAEAERLIIGYTDVATNYDVPNLRKLFKLHASELVRYEAGKALIRLNDSGYVEEGLQTEKSAKVVKGLKPFILRNGND